MIRTQNIQALEATRFDVCVVGAGINGAVSAAALSARGLKVALIDKGDFGGLTSSQSSNLAWGGIKYLENREFGLVWKLCRSRNELMDRFPSTVKEIRFLTTVERDFRFPAVFVYLGALLYWGFGRFKTRPPKYLSRASLKSRESLVEARDAVAGIEYSDCYLHDNDSRFVWGFVRRAMRSGCVAANYVSADAARRVDDRWRINATDQISGDKLHIDARALVNACGPYVDLFNQRIDLDTPHRHVFSKGIHLIVDRVLEQGRILTFFASDGRLFFVMPMAQKTCIGTTDTRVESPETAVTDEDRDFVLANANELLDLQEPMTRADIIAERCGVRPLAVRGSGGAGDWISMSRKHAIDVNAEQQALSIFGGKITDCVNVGEEVCEHVEQLGIKMPAPASTWYGEPDANERRRFHRAASDMNLQQYGRPDNYESLADRLWRRYGLDAFKMLESIRRDSTSAERVIRDADYMRCEIEHTASEEMIVKLEDFLRRRSKISLVVRRDSLLNAPGLKRACEVFFGERADAKFDEYFAANPDP